MHDGLPNNPNVSKQALAALHGAAHAWAMSLTGHRREHAADVLQQSYLAIVAGGARFEGRSSLKTFLFGVVRRTALRAHRTDRRHLALAERLAREPTANPESPAVGDPVVSRALTQLPLRQQQVIELVIHADLTLEESAAVLGISVGSTRTHYHRAKATLRKLLGGGDE